MTQTAREGVLDEQEVEVEKVVSIAKVTTESATTTTVDELTLDQTLIEIKAAKPKVRGDKVETDYELAQRLQADKQEELTIEEKSKLFQQILEKRRKYFASKRAEERRSKPPIKAQLRTDGSVKTYLLFSQLLKEFDREDLENLWKLVKAKHENTRLEEGYERVLWGDLKIMFEDMHVYMLVDKRYSLTPTTITDMLNKKLKPDYWNEMCYQLLKLMTKQLKK
ncbi:hypothetical protein Tco_1192113 [Tanacetum coccineum]